MVLPMARAWAGALSAGAGSSSGNGDGGQAETKFVQRQSVCDGTARAREAAKRHDDARAAGGCFGGTFGGCRGWGGLGNGMCYSVGN
jgi:hypothetical protein